ncbi:hypothetical protein RM780_25435 [Streptomyces sp. DSM 44917]|uniref:Uncharacterized protein n=1 Tax=Streptomyces boetiae TaxID=3075541 RepID=A0ABU2LFC1_9ACTN|nr:hypothetical protein [Streptomyces sp. DSM 44917]MDT0310269.1 hypothetical protein [Streptomyces sp. DSM 44917]
MAQFGDGGGGTEFGDAEELKGFKPLPDDLRPEVRSFVLALRGLFNVTGKSLRVFAVYHHISPPSVSRYLKGADPGEGLPRCADEVGLQDA